MILRSIACLLVAAFAMGCSLEPFPKRCPAWSMADASGECSERAFSLPSASDAIGSTGARFIDVAMDGHGHGHGRGIAAWQVVGEDESFLEIAEELDSGSFSLRIPTAALSGASDFHHLSADEDGGAMVSWAQGSADTWHILVSERDAGGTWHDPNPDEPFSFEPTAYEPKSAPLSKGGWLVTWNQWDAERGGFGVAVAERASASSPWVRPKGPSDVLSPPVFFSNGPQIAQNDAGAAILTWYQSNGGPLMVYVSERSGPGQAFSRPDKAEFLSPPGASVDSTTAYDPSPALSSNGDAAVVWSQENGQGSVVIYMATRDASGSWTRPRDLQDSFSRPLAFATGAFTAFGPRGDLYVVWAEDAGKGSRIVAARRTPEGKWIESGTNPIVLSSEDAVAVEPQLAVGPKGGVIAVWSEIVGGHARIAARRTGSTDEPWGPIEELSPDDGTDAVWPSVAIGPGDRAIVGWTQGSFEGARAMIATLD